MTRSRITLLAILLLAALCAPAEARRAPRPTGHETTYLPHPDGCPRRAFCGCGAALERFGRHVRGLWLARAWLAFPRVPRGSEAPGHAAARSGHVFIIKAVLGNGLVMAYDANSGGRRTRLHVRSLAGFTVVDPSGYSLSNLPSMNSSGGRT